MIQRRRYMGGKVIPPDYLRFTALESGTFTLTIPSAVGIYSVSYVEYSTDEGATWVKTNNSSSEVTITTPTIATGDSVLWRGSGTCYGSSTTESYNSKFTSTGTFSVSGDITILLNPSKSVDTISSPYCFAFLFKGSKCTTTPTMPSTTLSDYAYYRMYAGCTYLTSSEDLPATTIGSYTYYNLYGGCPLTSVPSMAFTSIPARACESMFQGCTSLTSAPTLNLTSVGDYGCRNMFYGCSALTSAGNISFANATLGTYCFDSMFYQCISLTSAPNLPMTTLNTRCYYAMFSGCTSLTTAPELPATTLANYCYSSMFLGCSSLTYIKAMFTTTPGSSYTSNWVRGVASSGIFVKNSAAQWNVTGDNGVPTGWTVQTASS